MKQLKKELSMQIEIKCKGAVELPIESLLDFQGDLKVLSDESYAKFKSEILELGFSEPISIWVSPEGKNYILNGHQRRKTLLKLQEEGYEIPLIPVSLIEADNIKQAKKKVLALTSQFGTMTQDGLINFCEMNELNIDDMMKEFRFPEIPMLKFQDNDFDAKKEWEGMPEFDQDDKKPYRQIIISFDNDEDATKFGQLIGQTITEKTKSTWFPKKENMDSESKRYG
jgi:hypothetical protein